ncbi:hypothetical protein AVEN_198948-1 [Araneus ventricosus]|uniref:Uncharacterized protein n=1 Tax=Araneus ventricosus TaxID=182803 RepID=A0A4Y2P8P0_ARAVE|nr:hypothetical protein AVEN_198948-1 [Araneus ventricosus]
MQILYAALLYHPHSAQHCKNSDHNGTSLFSGSFDVRTEVSPRFARCRNVCAVTGFLKPPQECRCTKALMRSATTLRSSFIEVRSPGDRIIPCNEARGGP